ncbi:MAG: hypothetical protein WBQ73_01555, partial [Candidatus Babeliales bacterium]
MVPNPLGFEQAQTYAFKFKEPCIAAFTGPNCQQNIYTVLFNAFSMRAISFLHQIPNIKDTNGYYQAFLQNLKPNVNRSNISTKQAFTFSDLLISSFVHLHEKETSHIIPTDIAQLIMKYQSDGTYETLLLLLAYYNGMFCNNKFSYYTSDKKKETGDKIINNMIKALN